MSDKNKVVLAYSGGLDTSVILKWLQDKAPRVARAWLLGVMAAGLMLGLTQQLRGAHFMSHTLWTAWVCWTTAALAWGLQQAVMQHGMLLLPVFRPRGRS